MKIQPILFALCALILTSCNAQTTAFTVSNTVKGNTGHRGIMPQEEETLNPNEGKSPKIKPIEGKDYYGCNLEMSQDCTLELVGLVVNKEGTLFNLSPKFEDGQKKKRSKKGIQFT